MLLLEQNTIRKGQIDKNVTLLEFKAGDDEEYEMEEIRNSAMFAKSPMRATYQESIIWSSEKAIPKKKTPRN